MLLKKAGKCKYCNRPISVSSKESAMVCSHPKCKSIRAMVKE